MDDAWLSSAEAATLLGVSPASVKRWADDGLLPCARTAGGHRRFARLDVERFRGLPVSDSGSEADVWVEELLLPASPQPLEGRLLTAREHLGSWWRVADSLGPALTELGARWSRGEITVVEEHMASERISRALARVCEWMPTSPRAPLALLCTAEGDEHTLGLSLCELVLRERGWSTQWSGRRTPIAELAATLPRLPVSLVAVSASPYSNTAPALAVQARRLAEICRPQQTRLILGGHGRWPDPPPYGHLVRDFATLATLLQN